MATTKKAAAKTTTTATTAAAEKKPAVKKTTTKASTKSKDYKTTVTLQFAGKETCTCCMQKKAVEAFVAAGNDEKNIKSLALYVKPEDNKVYFVVNDDQEGSFVLFED